MELRAKQKGNKQGTGGYLGVVWPERGC